MWSDLVDVLSHAPYDAWTYEAADPILGEAVALLQLMIAAGAGWGLHKVGVDPPDPAGNKFMSSRMYTASYGDGPGKAFGAPAAGLRNLKIHGSHVVLLSHTGVIALP